MGPAAQAAGRPSASTSRPETAGFFMLDTTNSGAVVARRKQEDGMTTHRMKIIRDCFVHGEPAEPGDIVDVSDVERDNLKESGRGEDHVDAPAQPAEQQ
jgi:hypothetical protein